MKRELIQVNRLLEMGKVLLLCCIGLSFIYSCTDDEPRPKSKRSSMPELVNGIDAATVEAIQAMGLPVNKFIKLPKVNPEGLTLRNFSVGLKDLTYGSVITLSYDKDAQADYIQIKRCDKSIKVDGLLNQRLGEVTMEDVIAAETKYNQITNGNVQGAREVYQVSDFWRSASVSGCEVITNLAVEDRYYDLTAKPDHEYYYLARVCVRDSRIDEVQATSKGNCSSRIKSSNTITYVEPVNQKKKELKLRYQQARNKMNKFVYFVHDIAIKLYDSYDKCELKNIEGQISKTRKEGLALIAGMSVGAVASVVSGGWSSMLGGISAGAKIGSAFSDIMASPSEYERKCTEAEKYQGQLEPYQNQYLNLKAEIDDILEDLKTVDNIDINTQTETDTLDSSQQENRDEFEDSSNQENPDDIVDNSGISGDDSGVSNGDSRNDSEE